MYSVPEILPPGCPADQAVRKLAPRKVPAGLVFVAAGLHFYEDSFDPKPTPNKAKLHCKSHSSE